MIAFFMLQSTDYVDPLWSAFMRFLKFVQTGCEFVLMHFQKKGNNIELLQMDLSTVNEGNEICGII